MLNEFSKKGKSEVTWNEMKHAILRNFDGLQNVNPVHIFDQNLTMDKDRQV